MGQEENPTIQVGTEIAPTVSTTDRIDNTNPEKEDSLEQVHPPSAPEAAAAFAKNKKRALTDSAEEQQEVLEKNARAARTKNVAISGGAIAISGGAKKAKK